MALSISPVEIVRRGEYQLLTKADHWERARLGEVAHVQNGFPFKSELFDREEGVPLIRIRDVNRTTTEHRYRGDFDPSYIVRRGDIIIGMDGDFKAARWKGGDALLNQRVCRITLHSDIVAPDFLFICLQPYLNAINAETSSITVKHLSSRTVEDIPLPLPPLREQYRIVAKIEELFTELDKAVESLTRARAQLKTYNQALLKAAFEGKLTDDWRTANLDKLESPETLLARIRGERHSRGHMLDQRALRELPKGWAWTTVQNAGEVQLGRQRAPQHHTGDHIRPYLRVANVLEDALDLRNVKEMNFTPEEFETFALRDGDVLLNEGQAPELLGRPAIYRNQIPGCCFQKTLLRFRPGLAVNSEFALIVFRHYMRSGRFKKEARITTNIGHLTQMRFVVMEFPIPTRAEQDEIVRRFRELEVLGLGAEINTGLAKVSALRQSILKKAFSGHLVPQDTADDPAAALLVRLRDAPATTRTRRRKTA